MPDAEFPQALAALAEVQFDYRHGEGVDYEPYSSFLSPDDTTEWLRAWTGNGAVSGDAFRVFGQDGTGGYAAFWLVREHDPLPGQPVVFLGSEGETGVVARDLSDYLWLLADGSGPFEAVEYGPEWRCEADEQVVAIAEQYAQPPRRTAREVVVSARGEFPQFAATIEALCI